MKIKSLLFAAAAFAALSMNAETVATMTAENVNIESADQLGQLIEVPITLGLEGDLTTWKNIQIDLTYPEGITPALDEFGDYGYATFDTNVIPNVGRPPAPAVAFSTNFATSEDNNYIIIGSNMTATACNPGQLYTINIMVDENAANGEYPIMVYSKVVLTDDSSITVGSLDSKAKEVLCTVNVNLPVVGVNDVNAAKAVSSVKYYNAAGMASDTAFDGINIVVTKYADGSQSTTKVVK